MSRGTESERKVPVHEPDLGPADFDAVLSCLRAGQISGHAPIVQRFEEAFAAWSGADHAVAVSSGTAALHLAMAALDLRRDDEVVLPSFTFAPCADAVVHLGARPIFVDSDEDTLCINVEEVARAIGPRTRAVLGVHMYGNPCDAPALRMLCDERGLLLIEDAAQGLGARIGGRSAGQWGHLGCFSFYANKVITAGEGGMVVTGDARLAERVRQLRNHALRPSGPPYFHNECAFNYRMPALCAALGASQLGRIDEFLRRRKEREALYRRSLEGLPGLLWTSPTPKSEQHGHWCHVVMVDEARARCDAPAVARALAAARIETRRFYHPLHLHPPYHYAGPPLSRCERFAARGLVLPSGNGLPLDDVRRVCDVLNKILS